MSVTCGLLRIEWGPDGGQEIPERSDRFASLRGRARLEGRTTNGVGCVHAEADAIVSWHVPGAARRRLEDI